MRLLISGFYNLSLTRAAVLRARELGASWASEEFMPINDPEYKEFNLDKNFFVHHDVPRNDEILLQVFDELGEKISSSGVHVVEVPDDIEYYIECYIKEWISENHQTWRKGSNIEGEQNDDFFSKDSKFSDHYE